MTYSSGITNPLHIPKMMVDAMMLMANVVTMANLTVVTHPMMNFILPALPVCTMVGMHCGSRGPNIP